jgi:hypothetical protein
MVAVWWLSQGGISLKRDGKVVGAIGVSGSSGEQVTLWHRRGAAASAESTLRMAQSHRAVTNTDRASPGCGPSRTF